MSGVSSEYAKALFMLAMENESGDEYDKALDVVSDAFAENPAYMEFLTSPGIALSERLGALEGAFSGAVPRDVLSFLKLLCEKRHIGEFADCAAQYKTLLNEVGKVSNAKVTSAVELDEKEKETLRTKLEKLSGHTVVFEYTIDKSILGGLIVEMDGRVMDSSLRKHLKDVKDVISR